MTFELAALAVLFEALLGYPAGLVRRIGHPVIWIGRLILALDRRLNRPGFAPGRRRLMGVVTVALVLAAAALPALALEVALRPLPFGLLILGLAGSSLIAQRSLHWHVARVADALETGSLDAAREAVGHIVGRDPQTLDASGVARAAIESLAENFSDGVVAPTLWLSVAGLAGGAAYKALNTADSMIGHLTERHAAFGWAAARADDYVNLPASRLAGMLIIAGAGADARRTSPPFLSGHAARRPAPPLPQRRLARGGHGGSPRAATERPEGLCRACSRRTLTWAMAGARRPRRTCAWR